MKCKNRTHHKRTPEQAPKLKKKKKKEEMEGKTERAKEITHRKERKQST